MKYSLVGWPKNQIKAKKPQIIYKKDVIYFSKFIRRNINIILDKKNFQIEKKWYLNKKSSEFIAKEFLTFNFFRLFKLTLPIKFFKILKFLKKSNTIKTINIKKNEIVLFGPFSWNYAHQIHEFLIRVVYLKKKNFDIIYLPINLKKIISSKTYKKIFKNKSFKFYSNSKDLIFENVNYLSHIENRFQNYHLNKSFFFIRNEAQKIHLTGKNHFIFISRNKTKTRKLLNEEILYNKLKRFGFKRVLFEDLSIDRQIEISINCKIMIGYHGAGIANCIYMNKNSFLIEIFNKNYIHPHFKLFSDIQKINYYSINCKINFKNLDGICDVDEVVNYVKKIT